MSRQEVHIGKVVETRPNQPFGFVATPDPGKDAFFHQDNRGKVVRDNGRRTLERLERSETIDRELPKAGKQIAYTVKVTERGPRADIWVPREEWDDAE